MIINIDLDFKNGDNVRLRIYNPFGNSENYIDGYIVGFKYTNHCYLEEPDILYAVLLEDYYEDYKESIDKGEKPFQFCLYWGKVGDIEIIDNKIN